MEAQQPMEPLAIVGMACRFPGGLDNLKQLWEALKSRMSAIRETPANRWSADRYYAKFEGAKGKAYVRRGGYINQDPREFDASFFGISPRDAENMDPQQRLILEVCWEAFENAGIPLPSLAGQPVGVYVGGFMLDHMITQMAAANRSQINQNSAAGMMMTMLSNRISHVFDLRGPSLSIDTACSSSLVAFHVACQDLWAGRCELAIVGGVNVMTRPEYPIGMSKGQFLSRDGQCKSFDSRADGYGRAEGAGIVLVKPLAKAIADGDMILAKVLGTGTNQDGHTPGISMPSGEAQAALIRDVCQRHHIDPGTIDYVECHGTGTAIGDPIEATAIGTTYGASRDPQHPVIIGSIKSNIGHMEAGAGVAGVIKAVLTLQHAQTTPLASLIEPNPNIAFEKLNLKLSDDSIDLSATDRPLRVAINSFGYGGSNAHAILECANLPCNQPTLSSPPPTKEAHESADALETFFIPVTGKSANALKVTAARLADLLNDGMAPQDLIHTLTKHRTLLNYRAIVRGNSVAELIDSLRHLADPSVPAENAAEIKQIPFQYQPQPVFVFTGMGPQWWGMGQQLYRENKVYRQTVDQADQLFQQIAGFSILREMLKSEDDSRITQTEFAQPANFMIQIGILAILRSMGVHPGACVGHSVGELASAYASGVLSLSDALTVCFHRSRLQAMARGTGAMLAVGLNQHDALSLLEPTCGRVSIAAINGLTNLTLAGDSQDIEQIADQLTLAGIFNRRLDVEVPYHSPAMDPLMVPLATVLADVIPQALQIPLYSTVTGQRVDQPSYGADYWPLNIRQPVEFYSAIQSLLGDGYSLFIEIGPHPVLSTALKECFKTTDRDCRHIPTLRRQTDETIAIQRAFVESAINGVQIDWHCVNPRGHRIELPNYPWQREYYWLENPRAEQDRINPIVHPILGTQEAPGTPAWRNDFDYDEMNYLRDHQVLGLPILPAAGYIEAALELAAIEFPESASHAVRNFQIQAPLILKADRAIDFVTSMDSTSHKIAIRSLENGKLGIGQVHATAEISSYQATEQTLDLGHRQTAAGGQPLEIATFYEQLHRIGLQYGPAFQTVRQLQIDVNRQNVWSRIELPESLMSEIGLYRLHPSLLDGCFQTLMGMIDLEDATYLPASIDEIRLAVKQAPAAFWCRATVTQKNSRFVDCDLLLVNDQGEVFAEVRRLRALATKRRERVDQWGETVKLQVIHYVWNAGEALGEPRRLGQWLVVADSQGIAESLSERLSHYGATLSAFVSLGTEYSESGTRFCVRGEVAEDWKNVLSSIDELDGVLFAHTLDATVSSADPTGEQALRTLVTALQPLIGEQLARKPRIYTLTQSAVQVIPNDRVVNPVQSTFTGFAHVAFNEIDLVDFTTIDLPPVIRESSWEAVVQELICDAREDEVAIREGTRFVSELALTDSITADRTVVGFTNDNNPIQLRPTKLDTDVGTVRIQSIPTVSLGPTQVRIRVQKSVVPVEFVTGDPETLLELPLLEFVGEVIESGPDVKNLQPGTWVCGIGPSDATNQIVIDQSQLVYGKINPSDDHSALVANIDLLARLESIWNNQDELPQDAILIEANDLGLLVAEAIRERGGCPVMIAFDESQRIAATERHWETIVASPSVIEQTILSLLGHRRIGLIVGRLANWKNKLGWNGIVPGTLWIDTDNEARQVELPEEIGELRRSALSLLRRRPQRFSQAWQRAIERLQAGATTPAAVFEVALADIAWQKLPINASLGALIISFDTDNLDLPILQRNNLELSPNQTFLITGGFGGFGQQTARWLVDCGVRSLVLTGRRGADTPDKQQFVAELESRGVQVLAMACDASDRGQVRATLKRAAESLPPIAGIVHSAAAILDQPIPEIDLATLSTVMRNKALGAWILHEETRELPLEYFIMYSSAANLVGNSRQSIYSAANGYLNGLAHYRKTLGLPATSINWGAISDVGIVARDAKLEQFLRYVGLRGMTSQEALSLLTQGLVRGVTQFGATIIKSWGEWGRFEVRAGKSTRYQKLIAGDSNRNESDAKQALVAELAQLEPDDQLELLIALMTELIAGVLKIDLSQLAASRPISELGVDSLMATEIQMLLETKLGLNIAVLELIGDVTIGSLAKNCLANLQIAPIAVAAK